MVLCCIYLHSIQIVFNIQQSTFLITNKYTLPGNNLKMSWIGLSVNFVLVFILYMYVYDTWNHRILELYIMLKIRCIFFPHVKYSKKVLITINGQVEDQVTYLPRFGPLYTQWSIKCLCAKMNFYSKFVVCHIRYAVLCVSTFLYAILLKSTSIWLEPIQ